jgi:hypothetical protein
MISSQGKTKHVWDMSRGVVHMQDMFTDMHPITIVERTVNIQAHPLEVRACVGHHRQI